MRAFVPAASVAAAAIAMLAACPPPADGRAEERCYAECRRVAAGRCDEEQCAKGCRLILDRIVEREDHGVIACVASVPAEADAGGAAATCADTAWARCAALVGVHKDGGPPVPPPFNDEPEAEADEDDDASSSGGSRNDAGERAKADAGDGGSAHDSGRAPKGRSDAGAAKATKDAKTVRPTKRDAGR